MDTGGHLRRDQQNHRGRGADDDADGRGDTGYLLLRHPYSDKAQEQRVLPLLPGYRRDVQPSLLWRDRPVADCRHFIHPLLRIYVWRRRARNNDIPRFDDARKARHHAAFARAGHEDGLHLIDVLRADVRKYLRHRGRHPRDLAQPHA